MTTSRSKIHSLVVLARSASHLLARPRSTKPKESCPCPHPTSPVKRSQRKFQIFRSKIKRTSKISVCTENTISDDDDCSSTYSYSDQSYSQSPTCSSVPNLSATLQIDSWDDLPSTSMLSGYKHDIIQEETLREEDEDLMKMGQDPKEPGNDDDDDDDSNWGSTSNDGCLETPGDDGNQKRSSAPIPINVPPNKKRHHRAISLPQNLIKDLPKSLYHRQPTPSESWDNDFEVPEDFQVPIQVEESQVNIRMDMFNIQDFRTQVEEIKNLRTKKLSLASKVQSNLLQQRLSNCHARKNLKIFKNLEEMYKSEWEEVNVIIDISEMATDQETRFEDFNIDHEMSSTPSERHLHVLRKIIDDNDNDNDNDNDGDDDGDDDDDDDDSFSIGALDDYDKENDITNFNLSTLATTEPSSSRSVPANRFNGLMGESNSGWSFHGLKRDHSGLLNSSSQISLTKKKRRENVRISVDEMPSLIDHLRMLQNRLSGHVVQLADLEALRYESSIDVSIYKTRLY